VGVAPQYCGVLGKKANGQVAVTSVYVDPYYAWPVNGQLYLPESWTDDPTRRKRAAVPATLAFRTKPVIALELIDQAQAAGVPFEVVVADGGYGDNSAFLDGLDERKLASVVGIHRDFGVRLPDEVAYAAAQPLPPTKKPGRPRTHPHPMQVAPLHQAAAVLARQPEAAWQTISWRQGTDGPLVKRFVALRVHRAVADTTGPLGWLMGERPRSGESGEEKYYWSNLPATTPLARLVELAHRRPGIERFYEDGKGGSGLADYAARKWESFHRHLVIEFVVLSWLTLQKPHGAPPQIVTAPQLVASPSEPVFPLWARTLSERRADPPAACGVPRRRVDSLADAVGTDRHKTATGPTPSRPVPITVSQPVISP
jgi:SRSO17 transposase